MTDESKTPQDGRDATGPLAGERLAEARLKREISIHEVATVLHLDEPKVRALEQNAFELLGAPVFAKGYLRKYAELVGIPIDAILADYYRLNRSAAAPPIVGSRGNLPRDISPGPWIAGLLAIVLAAGAAWWWLTGGSEWFDNRTRPATLTPLSRDRDVEPPPSTAAETEPANGEIPDEEAAATDLAETPPVDEPSPETAAEPPQTTGPAEVLLSLSFSGDCWTEVTDAAGERLYFGLGTAGRAITVTGEPPLQVLVGNSANVRLTVNGSDYPIPRSARRGDTARLTIADR